LCILRIRCIGRARREEEGGREGGRKGGKERGTMCKSRNRQIIYRKRKGGKEGMTRERERVKGRVGSLFVALDRAF